MNPDIRQIRDEDVESFYEVFSQVVQEHKYLAFLVAADRNDAGLRAREHRELLSAACCCRQWRRGRVV